MSANLKNITQKLLRLIRSNLFQANETLPFLTPNKKDLLESISDGICVVNEAGKIVHFNHKFYKKFMRPLEIQEDQKEISLEDIFSRNHEEIDQAFHRVLKIKNSEILHHVYHRYKERDFYYDITINPIIIDAVASGTAEDGVVGIFHDVSQKRLTDLMRMNFVANISHEMRTPLTSVMGYAQILDSQKNLIPEQFHLYIEKIMQNSHKMQHLFSDILNLSVIESQLEIKRSEVNVRDLFENIKESLAPLYPQKNFIFSFNLATEILLVDLTLFEQIVSNLLDNSCKYAQTDQLHISVTLESIDKFFMLKYCDHGPAIAPDHIDRIFERFYRIEDPSPEKKKKIEGSGLGLSIVKQAIARHKGKVWAENHQGHTYFILQFPKSKKQL